MKKIKSLTQRIITLNNNNIQTLIIFAKLKTYRSTHPVQVSSEGKSKLLVLLYSGAGASRSRQTTLSVSSVGHNEGRDERRTTLLASPVKLEHSTRPVVMQGGRRTTAVDSRDSLKMPARAERPVYMPYLRQLTRGPSASVRALVSIGPRAKSAHASLLSSTDLRQLACHATQ